MTVKQETLIQVIAMILIGLFAYTIFTYKYTGSVTSFKVGDCVQYVNPLLEEWEQEMYVEKLLEKGKYAYRRVIFINGHWFPSEVEAVNKIYFSELKNYVKIQCPVVK